MEAELRRTKKILEGFDAVCDVALLNNDTKSNAERYNSYKDRGNLEMQYWHDGTKHIAAYIRRKEGLGDRAPKFRNIYDDKGNWLRKEWRM